MVALLSFPKKDEFFFFGYSDVEKIKQTQMSKWKEESTCSLRDRMQSAVPLCLMWIIWQEQNIASLIVLNTH